MTKIMPDTKQQLRYQWIKPIIDGEISIENMLKVCPFSERTIKYWIAKYRTGGIEALIDRSTRPHTMPHLVENVLKEKILTLRDKQRIGAKKIFYLLSRDGVEISERGINKILKREGRTKSYRRRREYIYHKKPITVPGEMVEIDIKYGVHFGFGRWWYQYTAIDIASRWRYLRGFDNRENDYSIMFLEDLLDRTKRMFKIKAVKTDNDSVFTNRLTGYEKSSDPLNPRLHALDLLCKRNSIVHYLIDPGKPTQNGHVERSHRTDKDYFYKYLKRPNSVEEYNYKLSRWNRQYNNLPHCSLDGLSPNEYLANWVQNVRA